MKKKIYLLLVVLIIGLLSFSIFAAEKFDMKISDKSYVANNVSEDVAVIVNDDQSLYLLYNQGDFKGFKHFKGIVKTSENGVIHYRYSYPGYADRRESFTLIDARNAQDDSNIEKTVQGEYSLGYGWCGTMDFFIKFSIE